MCFLRHRRGVHSLLGENNCFVEGVRRLCFQVLLFEAIPDMVQGDCSSVVIVWHVFYAFFKCGGRVLDIF